MKRKYLLLHKNFPVASLVLNDKYSVEKIAKIHNTDRLPVGLYNKQLNISDMDNWLFGRAIPQKREGLHLILHATGTVSNKELLIKNLGLGLTDCYWIKPEGADFAWENINFFSNNFDEEINQVYLRHSPKEPDDSLIDKVSPNNVSSGMLPKGWICKKNRRYMIKGSEFLNYQEPFNEVIISNWLDSLKIDHVKYWLQFINKKPYCVCENMLKENEELIHSYYVINIIKKDNRKSYLDHYIDCCARLGLKGLIRQDLEIMILIDYMTANTDRHWSNFGVIRDSDTLQLKRLAPIYDNGAALFAKIPTFDIKEANKDLSCHSFNTTQAKNVKLVGNFDILDNPKIKDLPDLIMNGYNKNPYMDNIRINEIVFRIRQRIKTVFGISKNKQQN